MYFLDHSCFELLLSHPNETMSTEANVGIEIRANGFMLKEIKKIPVLPRINQVTFLQTDRQIYKPGDIFKIRIFILNKDALASEEQTVVLKIICVFVLNDSSSDSSSENKKPRRHYSCGMEGS